MAVLIDLNISSTDDMMTAIHTFLTSTLTNTWTDNGINTGTNVAGLSIGNLFVQFSWTGSRIDMSQSTATVATAVFDSEVGNVGHTSEALFPITVTSAELKVFANDTATTTDRYAHCVVEFNKDGRFIHFGFGQVDTADKFFAWSGGAYKYGGEYDEPTFGHQPYALNHRILIDGLDVQIADNQNLSTIRIDNVEGQPASSVWGVFSLGTIATLEALLDDAGNPLSAMAGMSRFGPIISMSSFQRQSTNNAAIHLIPILLARRETTTNWMPLGQMPDVRVCNIGNIQPKQQLTFDTETWEFYPWYQKLTLTSDQNIGASRNAGIAYKVT